MAEDSIRREEAAQALLGVSQTTARPAAAPPQADQDVFVHPARGPPPGDSFFYGIVLFRRFLLGLSDAQFSAEVSRERKRRRLARRKGKPRIKKSTVERENEENNNQGLKPKAAALQIQSPGGNSAHHATAELSERSGRGGLLVDASSNEPKRPKRKRRKLLAAKASDGLVEPEIPKEVPHPPLKNRRLVGKGVRNHRVSLAYTEKTAKASDALVVPEVPTEDPDPPSKNSRALVVTRVPNQGASRTEKTANASDGLVMPADPTDGPPSKSSRNLVVTKFPNHGVSRTEKKIEASDRLAEPADPTDGPNPPTNSRALVVTTEPNHGDLRTEITETEATENDTTLIATTRECRHAPDTGSDRSSALHKKKLPGQARGARLSPPKKSNHNPSSAPLQPGEPPAPNNSTDPDNSPEDVEESRKQAPSTSNVVPKKKRPGPCISAAQQAIWDARWDANFTQLEAFKQEHGHLTIPKEHGHLREWTWSQKRMLRLFSEGKRRNANLDRIKRLEQIGLEAGLPANHDAKWDANFAKLEAFTQEHGHCTVPRSHEIGLWTFTQRQFLRKFADGKCPDANLDRINRLERVGLGTAINAPKKIFNTDLWDKRWMAKYEELAAFRSMNGHVNVRHEENPSLHTWVESQRGAFAAQQKGKTNGLTQERMMKLVGLGIAFQKRESFEMRFKQLLDYKRINGDTRVPVKYSGHNNLGRWCRNIRRSYHFSKLGKDSKVLGPRIAQLESIGFDFALRKKGLAGRTQDAPPSERVNRLQEQDVGCAAIEDDECSNAAQLEEPQLEEPNNALQHLLFNPEESIEDSGEPLAFL